MSFFRMFFMLYVGFISNSMYFVGCVILIWLGFRMANNIYNSPDANMASKIFTSLYCVLVAMMTFYTQQIGAAILDTAVTSLTDVGAASAERMVQYVDNPLTIGGTVQTLFVLVVLVFQLAITWSKK